MDLNTKIEKMGQDDINEHIFIFRKISGKYSRKRKELRVEHPKWDINDPRLSIIALPGNYLVGGLINALLWKTCLCEKQWWLDNVPVIPQEQISYQAEQYTIQNKTAVYISFFFGLEAQFRKLFMLIFPEKHHKKTDRFSKLYVELLNFLDLQKFLNLMDFARELRNTTHNNGLYLNKKAKNLSFT